MSTEAASVAAQPPALMSGCGISLPRKRKAGMVFGDTFHQV